MRTLEEPHDSPAETLPSGVRPRQSQARLRLAFAKARRPPIEGSDFFTMLHHGNCEPAIVLLDGGQAAVDDVQRGFQLLVLSLQTIETVEYLLKRQFQIFLAVFVPQGDWSICKAIALAVFRLAYPAHFLVERIHSRVMFVDYSLDDFFMPINFAREESRCSLTFFALLI